jgi:ssDNA-binding replication factor A large subunit
MPINALNSYQNRWTIKARVTNKSEIRRYSNARGEGKFFSFDLLDAAGGEIRVVCWNDQVSAACAGLLPLLSLPRGWSCCHCGCRTPVKTAWHAVLACWMHP